MSYAMWPTSACIPCTTLPSARTFFCLTKNWTRGPLKPTQKQPGPDLAHALLANLSGNPPL